MRLNPCIALACVLAGQDPASAKPAPFGFTGPEIQRVEGQARALLVADFDRDGGMDAAFVNNGKARIEILYQRKPGAGKKARPLRSNRWEPQLQDSRFERDSITTGSLMYELAAGDLNNDGKLDLACTEDSCGLLVYYQAKNLQWEDPLRIELKDPAKYQGTLLIEDLDGDGDRELIVVADHEIHLYAPDKGGQLRRVDTLPAANEDPYNLQFIDLNADGRLDLMYMNPVNTFALRIRIQGADGHFGPEEVVAFDRPSGLIHPYPSAKGSGFVAVNRHNGQLEHFALVRAPPKARGGALFSLRAYAYHASDSSKQVLHAWSDLDGDGYTDLVTADPAAAQLSVYQNIKGELQSPVNSAAYSGISTLSPIRYAGKNGVLLTSPVEETWGVSHWKTSALDFPRPLAIDGKPLASAASTNPKMQAVVFLKEKARHLLVQQGSTQHTQELEGLTENPNRIHIVDLNQDGRADLLLEIPFKPLVILVQGTEGEFNQLDTDSGASRSLLSRLEPGSIGFADMDRDGKDEMLIVRKGFVRALRLSKQNTFETVTQVNASRSDMKIASAVHLQIGTAWHMVLVDRDKHRLELHQTHPSAPNKPPQTFKLPDSPVVKAEIVQLDPNTAPELILHGKKLFWRLSAEQARWQVQRVSRYETDLPDMRYSLTGIGDLNHDRVPDIVGIDRVKTHLLEILTYQKEHWQSRLHFKIFESDRPGTKGTRDEPREMLLEDFTSDGRTDIMMLIHDRMLLYPQDE